MSGGYGSVWFVDGSRLARWGEGVGVRPSTLPQDAQRTDNVWDDGGVILSFFLRGKKGRSPNHNRSGVLLDPVTIS